MSTYLTNHLRIPGGISISDLILIDSVAAGFTVAGFARQIRTAMTAAGGAG